MIEFQWWPRRKPIPEGWEPSPYQVPCHHHFYSILLIRIEQ